jgi:hypothetical protein
MSLNLLEIIGYFTLPISPSWYKSRTSVEVSYSLQKAQLDRGCLFRLKAVVPTLLLALGSVCASAAATIPVGILSFDAVSASEAQIDFTSQVGPNASVFPDPTFPVETRVLLLNLVLNTSFVSGPNQTNPNGDFTLEPDRLSFTGNFQLPLTTVTSSTLTGQFSTTTFTLNSGSTAIVTPDFSVSLTDPNGALQDGDFAIVHATESASATPEPASLILLGAGLGGIWISRRLLRNIGGDVEQ